MADVKYILDMTERVGLGIIGILFFIGLFMIPAQAAPLNASLVAYYPLHSGIDYIYNYTMTAYDHAAVNVSCKVGSCYHFDGTNDHINASTRLKEKINDNPANNPNVTVALWVKGDTNGGNDVAYFGAGLAAASEMISTGGAGAHLQYRESSFANYWQFINKGNPLMDDGSWHFILYQISGTDLTAATNNLKAYIDDALQTGSGSGVPTNTTLKGYVFDHAINLGTRNGLTMDFHGYIDEVMVFNTSFLTRAQKTWLYNSGAGRTYSEIAGGGAAPAATSAITFYKPDRPDILNYTTRTVFKVVGTDTSYSNVNVTINGVKVKTYATLANNTNTTYWFNSSEGNVTIGVYANNTLNATKVFRHLFYNVTDRDFRTSVNETTLQETNITIANGTGVIIQGVNLTIEGHATENITGASVVDGKWRAYYYAMVPSGDGATETLWWNITLRLPDGTVQKNRTSYAVTHHFGYNITGIRIKGKTNYAKAWAGELMPGSLYVNLPTQTARNGNLSVLRYNNGTAANWAYFSDTGGTNTTLHSSFAAPDVSIWNATKIFKYTMRVTDQYGNSRNSTWQRYARIYAPNQTTYWNTNGGLGAETGTYCNSGGDADAWSLTARDESDASRLYNPNMNIILKFWKNSTVIKKKSWMWNNTGISNLSICNYPYNFSNSPNVNSSLRMNATVTVTHTGYSSTLWTVTNALVNATAPSRYAIYLINSSVSTPITFYLYGNYDAPLEGYTLKVQKYYTGTGAYIDVFSGIADYEGKVTAYLQTYTTYYNYIIQDENGTVVKEYSPSTIATSPIYLRVTEGSENWPSTYYGISHDCAWSNTTKLLICTVNDPAGKVVTSTLTVERNVLFTNITECTTSASGSAVTLTCNLVNATGNMYWVLTTDITGYSEYVLEAGNIDGAMSAATFGSTGILAAIILMVSLGFGGFAMGGTAAGIAGALIGGVIMGYFGAFPALGPAEGTVIAGAFILLLIVALVVDR